MRIHNILCVPNGALTASLPPALPKEKQADFHYYQELLVTAIPFPDRLSVELRQAHKDIFNESEDCFIAAVSWSDSTEGFVMWNENEYLSKKQIEELYGHLRDRREQHYLDLCHGVLSS